MPSVNSLGVEYVSDNFSHEQVNLNFQKLCCELPSHFFIHRLQKGLELTIPASSKIHSEVKEPSIVLLFKFNGSLLFRSDW